jgi:hypothetical protein
VKVDFIDNLKDCGPKKKHIQNGGNYDANSNNLIELAYALYFPSG